MHVLYNLDKLLKAACLLNIFSSFGTIQKIYGGNIMNMEQINAKVLSNGMTRAQYYDSLNREFEQNPRVYNGYFNKITDIPYDTQSERQKYDVYMPKYPGKYPAIIRIHGGGWFMGDRSDFNMGTALPFLPHGFTVISIGYRLANEAVFPDPVLDVCKALKHIVAHAEEYQLDPHRMALMSGSAGTPIAALAALWNPSMIRSVMLRCSILDFKNMRSQFEEIGLQRERFDYPDEDTSIEALFMGGSTLELPEVAEQVDPKNHITKDCPKFMLLHGLTDIDTPYIQSVNFANQIKRVTGDDSRVELTLFPNTGHDNGLYDHPSTFEAQLDFFRRTLL